MTDAQFKYLVVNKIKSGSNILWLYTSGDEERAESLIQQIAETELTRLSDNSPYAYHTWDWIHGASWNDDDADPKAALLQLANVASESLFLFRDLSGLLNGNNVNNVVLRRAIIELCKDGALNSQEKGNVLIILSDTPSPHSDLRDYVDVIDVPMPGESHMAAIFEEIKEAWLAGHPDREHLPEILPDITDKITQALLGLTSAEAVRILAFASRVAAGFNEKTLNVISEEKVKFIRKIEGLQFVPNSKIMCEDEIGGYDAFKEFINKRSLAYSKHAQSVGLERPRGVFLIGVPGTAKTMAAKAVARMLNLDLIIIDVSAMLDSYVGNSEKKLRTALNVVSALPNAVCVLDELEKIVGGAHNSMGDSGVMSHMLSMLLSWLNDRDMADPDSNRVFVVATANRINNLPPELLRAGRFDRVFSSNLPNDNERVAILAIHLKKRGLDPTKYDLELVSKTSADFSGAELEEAVITARHEAYARIAGNADNIELLTTNDVAPTTDDLLIAIKSIKPLAVLDKESIKEIQQFCAERTYSVSADADFEVIKNNKRRILAN